MNIDIPTAARIGIGDDLDYQVSSLAAAIRMIRDELGVDYSDAAAVGEAVDRLFFLTDGIEAVKARLERIAAAARTLQVRLDVMGE
ncbi:MAG: hypothetical protein AB1482_03830 [Pseudomonadota bacterium]